MPIQYNLVISLNFQCSQWTFIAVFEWDVKSNWKVKTCAQEYLCVLVEAIFIWNPNQMINSFFEKFFNWQTTNCIGIRASQSFYFIFLKMPINIIEWLGCAWHCCCCDIIKIFELPVSPRSKIFCKLIGQYSDLFCTLNTIGKSPEFSHKSTNPHFLSILFFTGNCQLIETRT